MATLYFLHIPLLFLPHPIVFEACKRIFQPHGRIGTNCIKNLLLLIISYKHLSKQKYLKWFSVLHSSSENEIKAPEMFLNLEIVLCILIYKLVTWYHTCTYIPSFKLLFIIYCFHLALKIVSV
jgi:hypothetical protein